MMRFWTCLLLCLLLMTGCCGAEENILREQADALELDELERVTEEYLGEVDLAQGIDLDQGLEGLFETGSEQLHGVVKKAARSGVLLLVIVLFCSMADGISEMGQAPGISVTTLVGAIAVATVAVADIHALIGMGREAIGRMETLSKVLVPAMAVATAAAGAPASAAARQLATMFFADVLLTVINRMLLPLVYAYVAASAANAALGNEGVKKMAELIKWFVTSVLTLLLLAFVGYLSVSGVIAGTTDAVGHQSGKVCCLRHGTSGGGYPFRRGRDGSGRGGNPEKFRRRGRDAGCSGDLCDPLSPAWDPLSDLQAHSSPDLHCLRGQSCRPDLRHRGGFWAGVGHDGGLRAAADDLHGFSDLYGGEVDDGTQRLATGGDGGGHAAGAGREPDAQGGDP